MQNLTTMMPHYVYTHNGLVCAMGVFRGGPPNRNFFCFV